MNRYLDVAPEVQQAVAEGRPVPDFSVMRLRRAMSRR